MKNFLLGLGLFTSGTTASLAAGDVVYLDVRTPAEVSEKSIKGAEVIDFNSPDFSQKITKLDKEKTYKVFCRSGNRSGKAVQLMKAQGFKSVENAGSVEDVQRTQK